MAGGKHPSAVDDSEQLAHRSEAQEGGESLRRETRGGHRLYRLLSKSGSKPHAPAIPHRSGRGADPWNRRRPAPLLGRPQSRGENCPTDSHQQQRRRTLRGARGSRNKVLSQMAAVLQHRCCPLLVLADQVDRDREFLFLLAPEPSHFEILRSRSSGTKSVGRTSICDRDVGDQTGGWRGMRPHLLNADNRRCSVRDRGRPISTSRLHAELACILQGKGQPLDARDAQACGCCTRRRRRHCSPGASKLWRNEPLSRAHSVRTLLADR
jgi:hypothetical protein